MRLTDDDKKKYNINEMDKFIYDSKRTDYHNHPSYDTFMKALQGECSEEQAKKLWKLLLEGLREQYNNKKSSKLNEFAAEAGKCGLLSTGKEHIALWTGGFDMSRIAQELGYCTLEKTTIGSILNTTPLTSLWECEAKLWNELSRVFVQTYDGNEAHIYFRIMDTNSVLERQEVPMIKLKQNTIIHWHPIYCTNPLTSIVLHKYSEVGIDGNAINIEQNNSGFIIQEMAGQALQEAIRRISINLNIKSFEHANSPWFKPDRVPFASYE